jgi:soluble lytic murein transglycosylase-like protein
MKYAVVALSMFVAPALASSDVHSMLHSAAARHSVPASLVLAVAKVESNMTCGARNGNFRGVMQVGKGAAHEVGAHWPPRSCYDEIDIGVRYLKLAVARGGSGCVGASLYNAGINAPKRCSAYGRLVMDYASGRRLNRNVYYKSHRRSILDWFK